MKATCTSVPSVSTIVVFMAVICFLGFSETADAQETITVNCLCDTTDEPNAQLAADTIADPGDTVVMHNTQTGVTTVWNVNQQGTVSKGPTMNLGPGIIDNGASSNDGSGGITVSTGFIAGLGFYASIATAIVENLCLSAFPCTALGDPGGI